MTIQIRRYGHVVNEAHERTGKREPAIEKKW